MKKLWLLLLVVLLGCRPEQLDIRVTLMATAEMPALATALAAERQPSASATNPSRPTPTKRPRPTRPSYDGIPTPDPPHAVASGENYLQHIVRAGETPLTIAQRYDLSLEELFALNGLGGADFIYVGQTLNVISQPQAVGPSFKLVPDSEIVYGPTVRGLEVGEVVEAYQGYLARYEDVVEGYALSGVEIVELVAVRFSLNPRLLLAMLEYRTGWVTQATPPVLSDYLMGKSQAGYEGLYQQLAWAANQVNWGYYGRAEGGTNSFLLADQTRVAFAAEINHGTAAVQRWLGAHDTASYDVWLVDTSANGFWATYNYLFGNPFAYTYEPLWPSDLTQPILQLPFEVGVPWYYTGGPHGGWAEGSAWAALDFAPDRELRGCYVSETWTTAMAAGLVAYSDFGGVLLDLDGDGDWGTGWVIVYWHIDSFERVPAGVVLEAGERIGHASCEGGYSNGTHIHVARRYNGRWVAADGSLPFNLEGWVSRGLGREYDGMLTREEEEREACVCAEEANQLMR